jgi:hypothetical protein
MVRKILWTLILLMSTTIAMAEEPSQLPEPWRYYIQDNDDDSWLMLAMAEDDQNKAISKMPEREEEMIPYRPRTFTGNKIHKYLGIGSMVAALLSAISPKEHDGAHEYLADAAAGLGVGAVLTGVVFHGEEIELKNGFSDLDNLHALLTTVGTLGYILAVDEGGESGHAGLGAGGAISMLIGIKMTW